MNFLWLQPSPLPALIGRGTLGILHREGGQWLALGCPYFEDEPQQQMSMKRLLRDEAFLIAVTIANDLNQVWPFAGACCRRGCQSGLSALSLLPLSQPDARAATVFFDEFYPGAF